MRLNYKVLAVLCFIFAVILRVLLCWSNPSYNSFDNHFSPIFMIMDSGAIPAKDACWQCYHPPVFYWISAMVGNIALAIGVKHFQLLKLLQFISCLYGILTVGIVYLILRKLPLSDFSRLISFATVCFLPRHIYMSAMNSNDTISYLFVALSIYLLIIAIERKLHPGILVVVSVVISITLFTKYTSYILLPIILIVFASLFCKQLIATRKQVFFSFLLVILMPIILLGAYFMTNIKNYNSLLPWNVQLCDPSLSQPRDNKRFDFVSFKPWESINTTVIVPGKMHSFWTLVYSGMWYDNEPKFLNFLDSNEEWWKHYFGWRIGEEKFPGDNPSMSNLTKSIGASLMAFGLVPLILIIIGFYYFFRGDWKRWSKTEGIDTVKMNIFPTLLFSNIGGIIALAVRLPVYSIAKASYLLSSLPAFAVFLSLGLVPCERNKKLKRAAVIAFGVLFALASLHILHITKTIQTKSSVEESMRLNQNIVAEHVTIGLNMEERHNLDQAIYHFNNALKIDPDSAEAHCNLGATLIQKGALDEAIEHFEKAIKINARLAQAHDGLAIALAQKGKTEEAISHLRKAVQLQPDYEEAKRNLKIMLEVTRTSP